MKNLLINISYIILLITFLDSCSTTTKENVTPLNTAIKLAKSEMKRNPEAWMIDFRDSPKWGYTNGLVGMAFQKLTSTTKDSTYTLYIKNSYADELIDEQGIIKGYEKTNYNIDKVNSGRILFEYFKNTKDIRYKNVMDTLRAQMLTHPRTSDGGFWHKKKYTSQMWLDGIYMANPFLAEYGKTFSSSELFDEVIHQIVTVQKHTYDEKTGLNYHGWDESKNQRWANKETGQSPNFWGRAQGWYAMAIVDVLDYLPEEHEGRDTLISILDNLVNSIIKVRDEKTGLWYQVLDQGSKEGNYLESTCSSMFTYAMLKSIRKGYIDKSYKDMATKTYNSLVNEFIKQNDDGTISISNCCAVAGLGGDPYRDGTYEYYISEPVRDNDPKAVGPFILASLEMNNIDQTNN